MSSAAVICTLALLGEEGVGVIVIVAVALFVIIVINRFISLLQSFHSIIRIGIAAKRMARCLVVTIVLYLHAIFSDVRQSAVTEPYGTMMAIFISFALICLPRNQINDD